MALLDNVQLLQMCIILKPKYCKCLKFFKRNEVLKISISGSICGEGNWINIPG